jgi:hypothetical protein
LEPTCRFAYDLPFFGALTATLRPEILGETPEGFRMNLFVERGCLTGPRIDATIRPEGGDWVRISRDGVGLVDIRITLETSDGALILCRMGGRFDLGPAGYAMVAAGRFTGSPPLCTTPTFITADPSWQWLNRCQGLGIGRVHLEEFQVEYDIYVPEVGEGRASSQTSRWTT